jgi:hypothetical protein
VSRSDVGAVDAVKRIDAIFDIEREVNGPLSARPRCAVS